MLAKKNRLNKKEFDRFFVAGKRLHTPELQIIYAPHDSFQAAAVVGKKVYKRAVDRNQARRQIYAAVAGWQREARSLGVYIVVAKPTFTKLPQAKRISLVQSALAQVPVL